jgi:hypothetical protein
MKSNASRSAVAFTVIEFLILLGIIAVLALMILPKLREANEEQQKIGNAPRIIIIFEDGAPTNAVIRLSSELRQFYERAPLKVRFEPITNVVIETRTNVTRGDILRAQIVPVP